MADINLDTADKVNVDSLTVTQRTFIASANITAGAPCYIVGASGKVAHSDANQTPLDVVWGISTKTVLAGEAVTLVRRGEMSGWDLTALAYGAPVYLSDTVGRLADAAGGTNVTVGHVVPVFATTLGTAPDKAVLIELTTPELAA